MNSTKQIKQTKKVKQIKKIKQIKVDPQHENIHRFCQQYRLSPKIEEHAIKIFDEIVSASIYRSWRRRGIAGACILKVSERNKIIINIKELMTFFNLTRKNYNISIDYVSNFLSGKNIVDPHSLFTSKDYIRSCKRKLKLNRESTDLSLKISKNCKKLGLVYEYSECVVAAGSILLATEYLLLDIKRVSIADIFGISVGVISQIYCRISKYLEALVDEDITNYLVDKLKN